MSYTRKANETISSLSNIVVRESEAGIVTSVNAIALGIGAAIVYALLAIAVAIESKE